MTKFLIAFCAVLFLPTAAFADHDAEMIIAYQYADDAFHAPNIDLAHAHMHQVMNCLAGPKGKGFDIKYTNPCAKAGIGGIPDAPDSAMQYIMLTIMAELRAGLATTDLKTAQKYGGDAAANFSAGECALETGIHYG